MSRCSPIFRHIYYTDCKITMFKVEKQVLSALPRAEFSSLSNFPKICLHILVDRSSFYGNDWVESLWKKLQVNKH